jgi:antitoxin component YwqK of YwqJK toxin-antitoxin module
MKNHIYLILTLAIVLGNVFPASAQRSFRYRFSYNHTHDTLVYTKTRHYKKYQIKKTGTTRGIYNDWYKKGGGPLSEIAYEIVNGKIEHRKELVYTRKGELETVTLYDTVKPYNIKSFTRIEYFENGKKKILFTQKDSLLNGYYAEYRENGFVREEGNFENGFKKGDWKTFYKKGMLQSCGAHMNQKTIITCSQAKYGHYLLTVINSFTGRTASYDIGSLNCRVFDSLDTKYHLMKDGNINFPFTYYHKHGPWVYFNEAGDTTSVEYYENGELAEPSKMAQFAGGYDSLKTYLKRNIKNPIAAGEPELNGRVYVNLTVNSKGGFENIAVEERWAENVRTEAMRIVSQMPLWEPALLHGKPVAFNYTLCLVYQPGQSVNMFTNIPNLLIESNDGGVSWARNYGEAVVDGDNINEAREEGERIYGYTLVATDGASEQSRFYSDSYLKTVEEKEGKGMEYVVPLIDTDAKEGTTVTKENKSFQSGKGYEGPGSMVDSLGAEYTDPLNDPENKSPGETIVRETTRTISICVQDSLTQETIPFAQVVLHRIGNAAPKKAETNLDGIAQFTVGVPDNYLIDVSYPGKSVKNIPFFIKEKELKAEKIFTVKLKFNAVETIEH